MLNLNELVEGDILKYQENYTVIFKRIENDKVILVDDVIGEIKVLKSIVEQHYMHL